MRQTSGTILQTQNLKWFGRAVRFLGIIGEDIFGRGHEYIEKACSQYLLENFKNELYFMGHEWILKENSAYRWRLVLTVFHSSPLGAITQGPWKLFASNPCGLVAIDIFWTHVNIVTGDSDLRLLAKACRDAKSLLLSHWFPPQQGWGVWLWWAQC